MPSHLLDSVLCTSKIQLGGEFFEGRSTYAQQRHPFAYPDTSPVCRVQLCSLCAAQNAVALLQFFIFLGQEKYLLHLIPSHPLVQLGEMQDFVLSCMKMSETQIYLLGKHLIMGL